MSDVDEDFMCEDDEDYGLVSGACDVTPRSIFTHCRRLVIIPENRNTLKIATRSLMWISRISTTTARH